MAQKQKSIYQELHVYFNRNSLRYSIKTKEKTVTVAALPTN